MFGLDCTNTRNFSAIGGKTCLCAEVRSWKDGNTGVEINECGGNQFVPINGEKKYLLATFSPQVSTKTFSTRTSNADRFKKTFFYHVDLLDYLILHKTTVPRNVPGCQKHVQSNCNNNVHLLFSSKCL